MSGVHVPARRDTSLLTTVMKGVQIARDIYGIKVDSDRLEAQAKEQERAEEERKRLASGKLNQGERNNLILSGKAEMAQEGDAGAIQVGTDEQGGPLWMKPKTATQKKALLAQTRDVKRDGQVGTVRAWSDGSEDFLPTVPPRGAGGGSGGQKLVQVETTDDQGNPVTTWVTPKAGLAVPKAKPIDKAAQKSEKEADYRYTNLQKNAQKLRKLVAEHGTVEMTGAAGDQMDSLIYDMAVDYAKLVDPESIAREGEVAAAQKYMLGFRQKLLGVGPAGMTTSNDTALSQIDNYLDNLDSRLESLAGASGMKLPEAYGKREKSGPQSQDGEAIAAPSSAPTPPAKGTIVDGYEFQGGDPADQWNWKKVGGR